MRLGKPSVICLIMMAGLCQLSSISFPGKEFKNYSQALPGTDITLEMVAIKGGEYMRGSPDSETDRKQDEGPQYKVKVPDFWMGKFEITWDQYELFMQRAIDQLQDPSSGGKEIAIKVDGVSGATTPYVDMSFGMGKRGYPAINVTQYAASMYCKWLSAITGNFYRLPTEAEWEYACRAGTSTAYHFGDDPAALDAYGWFYENSEDKYHQVGLKKPNPWGLYDMHGNVAEWTLDQYDPNYYQQHANGISANDWALPTELYPRTVRGGSWYDDRDKLRSAARKASNPRWKQRDPQIPKSLWWLTNSPFVGFRVVRPLETPTAEEIEKYWMKPIKDI
ncbi:formylglycine-generating enzyme family protein [Fulvivirgaceae bacterium BMA12]|uniref:Formylglycine-generating enzyme family protein n=1 Tax=Agaribacillus aureus TaxID=3051825 RepID=A0ABT8L385_9BACT|nr:formylglycine-generating enzyme family protein [Fulvivirgaceae bacterium BMA12]